MHLIARSISNRSSRLKAGGLSLFQTDFLHTQDLEFEPLNHLLNRKQYDKLCDQKKIQKSECGKNC